jgi:hypothetical protein
MSRDFQPAGRCAAPSSRASCVIVLWSAIKDSQPRMFLQ